MSLAGAARRRLLLSAAAVMVLGTTVGGLGAAQAQAVTYSPTCPSGYACGWRDTDFGTNWSTLNRVQLQQYIPDLNQWKYSNTSYSANDSITSIQNNGNYQNACYYLDPNKKRASVCLPPKGGAEANLSGTQWNDSISSIYFQ